MLQRIGHYEGERIGHDAELDGQTPGRLAIDLNQDGQSDIDRKATRAAVRRIIIHSDAPAANHAEVRRIAQR